MDVDQVHQGVALVLPHVLREVDAAHHFDGVAHQGLENRVLLGGQTDGYASSHDLMAERIEREVRDGEENRRVSSDRRRRAWRRASSSAKAKGFVR